MGFPSSHSWQWSPGFAFLILNLIVLIHGTVSADLDSWLWDCSLGLLPVDCWWGIPILVLFWNSLVLIPGFRAFSHCMPSSGFLGWGCWFWMPWFGTSVFDSQLSVPASGLLVLACVAWTLGPQTPCVAAAAVGVIWKFRLASRPRNYVWSCSYNLGVVVRDTRCIRQWRPELYTECRYKSREHSGLAWGASLRKKTCVLTLIPDLKYYFFLEI